MSGLSSVIGVDEAASHAQTIFLFHNFFFVSDPNLRKKEKKKKEAIDLQRGSTLIGRAA